MRISYQCPAHLKFGLNIKAWSRLVETSRDAIVWLDSHDRFFDTWFLVAYSLVSCALVQVSTEPEFPSSTLISFVPVPHLGAEAGCKCRGDPAVATELC